MTEDALNRETAKRYSDQQLRDELVRIDNAIKQTGWLPGQRPSAVCHRYHQRRAIFQAELFQRSDSAR